VVVLLPGESYATNPTRWTNHTWDAEWVSEGAGDASRSPSDRWSRCHHVVEPLAVLASRFVSFVGPFSAQAPVTQDGYYGSTEGEDGTGHETDDAQPQNHDHATTIMVRPIRITGQ
jgi:hypothetical protein